MTRKDFQNILNYLRCHPSDAQKLATVLSGCTEDCINNKKSESEFSLLSEGVSQWISAREAGSLIGKSSTWVRRRIKEGLFSSARQTERGEYLFNKSEILADYNSYIMAKTRRAVTISN